MEQKTTGRGMRLYLISAFILVIGVSSAVLIYLDADNNTDRVLGYEIVGGKAYPIAPEDSKVYLHDLELYGGKANVLADEFVNWFSGLWHGRSLAFTVAFISIIVSFGFFIVARHVPAGPGRGSQEKGSNW